ncbi:MAG: Co2+/Mg2+ efflux protein ApaG [Rhodospirillales bacterium]|nr:Co2+/Mg2+ efflux protein ApaG [Rhodospirillales bacterium]MCB9995458.1 Co2+/Mg2+ efflux protein ApaG [Rhodospirillales bacterium]
MYSKVTNNIRVSVEPAYLEDQSAPEDSHYVWSYHVKIQNEGAETIQLRSRYWKITDNNGITQEVEGDGIVGEQPKLEPGGSYEYTSGAPLPTPGGIMVGTYRMFRDNGEDFLVDIPAFSLDSPYQHSVLN